MRIVIVGPAKARAALRRALAGMTFEVVNEAPTLAAARALDARVDAFVVASDRASEGDTSAPAAEPLTRREIDVLELLVEGLANKTIAGRLGISDQTVKFHVASICGKLGAANRTEAVRLAIRRGLVTI